MAGPQDVWRISGEDRAKHDAQFFQLKPVNGYITGTQARDFFMQSGLPTPVLGQIWGLADMNGDGKMDKKEFSVAMHLIKKKLQGYELPKVLPTTLKADPSPMMGGFSQPGIGSSVGMNYSMGGPIVQGGMSMQNQMPMMPQASLGTATMTTGSLGMPRMANGAAGSAPSSIATMPMTGSTPQNTGVPPGPAQQPGASIWALPHSNKLKHTQIFNANDRNKKGYLLGVEARNLLVQSGLPQQILAQVWTLADVDHDGKLTCDEFCIAMHLSELARQGHALPPTLPPELLPTKSRSGSLTSPPAPAIVPAGTPKKAQFGDLLSGMGLQPTPAHIPGAPQPVEELSIDEQVTFEDKRKENFDKGQAELERRRAILREQQLKEENARLEKERQEIEKRERQRQEAENRKQAEFQRQLERQREKEREIEEQRRKMMEQREAVKRERDRQRQMEWEKQRKEQLLIEKQREYEQLSQLKIQMANLKAELESLDGKKTEIALKITQVKSGVTDFTTTIDAMRVSRDRTLADIDVFERQNSELTRKLKNLGGEQDVLNVQVQTAQATPISDTHRTVSHSVELKRSSIDKLKKDVEQLENDTEARLGEIDCNNAELKNLKDELSKLEIELPQRKKQQEESRAHEKKAMQELQQKQQQEKAGQEKLKKESEQQKNAEAEAAAKKTAFSEPNWFDFSSNEATTSAAPGNDGLSNMNWESAFSTASTASITHTNTTASSVQWDTSGADLFGGTPAPAPSKTKYKTIYDFVATREDELSFVAGDEVMVLEEASVPGMEDWHKGELRGATGWFPKAYVEKVEEKPSAFGSAFQPVQSTAQPSQDNSLFNSNISQLSATIESTVASVKDTSASPIPPEGLLAKATYPWKARQESDLTFDKDDMIVVKEQQEMKWFGELNGQSGWFPKAYVKVVGVACKSESQPAPSQDIALPEMVGSTATITLPGNMPPESQDGEYYIAVYTYASDEPADLMFNEGDMILVTSTNGDWWTGSMVDQGKSGIFPANYVKKLEIQPEQKSAKKPEIARVIAPYVATGTGQLSLETGNLINVRQKSPRGWWEGELQVRGQKKKIGWFPANYVKLLGSLSARSTPEPSSVLMVGSQGSRSATPQSTASQDGLMGVNQKETVVALYAYTAQNDDELTFQKDAVITVLSRENPDWWSGQLDGQTGVFPSNYVTPNPQTMS